MKDNMSGSAKRRDDRMMIAGIQMAVPASGSNLDAMGRAIARTMLLFPDTEMIVFSELAQHGPVPSNTSSKQGDIETLLSALASRHGIWLVPGSGYIRKDDGLYNHAIAINPKGEIVGGYNKFFPFLPLETGVEPGTDFLVFDVPDRGRFGVSICYDMWFPETTRTLTSLGVEVLLHPVLTGTTDRKVELAIAQATAAMFQCYVFDVNGLEAGGIGRSLVVDPAGVVLHQAGQTEEIFPITVDFDFVRHVRVKGANGLGQTLKSFRDRKVEFPSQIVKEPSTYLQSLGPLRTNQRD